MPFAFRPISFRALALLVLLALYLVLLATIHAHAQTTQVTPAVTIPSITIPWGDWATALLNALGALLTAVLTYAVGRYAPALATTFLSSTAISNAVNYGLGAVEGAVQGKTLTVNTTNSVLGAAEAYLVAHAPLAAKSLGGMIRPAILAELSKLGIVPPEASAVTTGAVVPGK